jgi:selenocysteine lyase/cysteine desulfurase
MHPDDKVKQVRAAHPVTRLRTYLGTGSLGAVSTIYESTLCACAGEDLAHGRALQRRYERLAAAREHLRRELALLLNVAPERIALTQGTADSLRGAIDALTWRTGDEVICTQLEHAACSTPLVALANAGRATLRTAQVPSEPSDDLRWLTKHLNARTRLVAFSAVAFETGQRLPIAALVAAVQAHGALTLLDAAQAAGAMALDLTAVPADFCALPLQKWLGGAEGLGALIVRESTGAAATDRVTRGWGEFEASAAHLGWMRQNLGWSWIFERVARLAAYARRRAASIPALRLLTPPMHAGLVTFAIESCDLEHVGQRLRTAGFVFRHIESLRALRISTAAFNTEEEIDRFYEVLVGALEE